MEIGRYTKIEQMSCRHAGGLSSIDVGSHNNEDIREEVKRFLELAERAVDRWDVEACKETLLSVNWIDMFLSLESYPAERR